MHLILCPTDRTEKARGTQEMGESANSLLRYLSHKQERREASASMPLICGEEELPGGARGEGAGER